MTFLAKASQTVKIGWRVLTGMDRFLRSQPYLPKEQYFDVEIRGGLDHQQAYGVQFKEIPVPTIRLLAGRLEWDPVLYAHDHFIIRTRYGTWEGFGTGQARLGYVVEGVVVPGWLAALRRVWRPRPKILVRAPPP